jgi:hypothetical protein
MRPRLASSHEPQRGEHRPQNQNGPRSDPGAVLLFWLSVPVDRGRFGQVNLTATPALTAPASCSTSQLVRRTQPLEAALPIVSGFGVPWMP